jgi:SPP1 gp7 family putative phage head morphogenesis protein
MPDSSYLDLATKRQSILERVKSGQVKDYGKVIKRIEKLIKRTLSDLDTELDELSFRQLNALLVRMRIDQGEIYLAGNIEYNKQLATIATVSASQELLDLTATVDLRGTVLKPFTKQKLYADVLKQPLNANGKLMEVFIKDFSATENRRVTDAIRNGHSLGRTNQEMIRELVGTKSANFKDGILQTTRRNAESMVRTATQHVSSAAQHQVWTDNRNVISMYKFVATLDRKTSDICRSLDGQEFEFGKGPIPPVHIRAVIEGGKITTQRGLIPIESVKVGDMALTHMGRWMPVTAVMSRDIDDNDTVHELKDSFGGVTRLTNDHPVLCLKEGWKGVETIKIGTVVFQNLNQLVRIKNRLFGSLVKNSVLVDSHNIPTETTERLVSYEVSTLAGSVAATVKLDEAISDPKVSNKGFNWLLTLKAYLFSDEKTKHH